MPENFEDFLKNIPESVAEPLEKEDGADAESEGQDLLKTLEVLKESEGTKEAQLALLPRIKETIAALREAQVKNDTEPIRNGIVKLVAERDRIEQMIN